MDPVRFSIKQPVAVIVVVLLILLFGFLGLKSMPYQLSPSVTEPVITVTTTWTGATPYEVERDIIEEQEKVLKGIPGLTKLESDSLNSMGTVTLTFSIDTDIDNALLRVSNKLNEVRAYPQNADRPIITATGASTSPIIWMILRTEPGNTNSAYSYRTFFENEVRQYLERVEGVADLFMGGGTEDEMHVVVDPEKLAAYKLTIPQVAAAIASENVNVSAGNVGVGRRDFRVRTVAQFRSPEDIAKTVIVSDGNRRVLVSDVAEVNYGHEKVRDVVIHNGTPGIAIGIKPIPGANVLDLTDNVEKAVQYVNENILKPKQVKLEWVYDQRPYIRGALKLMQQNILIGGLLAVIVLFVFLRTVSSTLIVATAIPISVVGTFMFMDALGRTLNVVSLAGISFAVGMLVDNAIVVLENIDRHRKMGKTPFEASYDGAKEVWGAVLASTLTTIAVFLPVVFVKQEAGQLFKDIAIAVTFALIISLFVSISVIPMLSRILFKMLEKRRSRFTLDGVGRFGGKVLDLIMVLVRAAMATPLSRIATMLIIIGFSVGTVILLFPKMEYLPQGNRNLVLNIIIPPPGLSTAERKEIGDFLFASVKDRIRKDQGDMPGIRDMFYVGAESIMICGAISTQEQQAGKLVPLFQKVLAKIPGVFGVSNQVGVFQTSLGGGRTIDLDIRGNDINGLVAAAGSMFGMLMQKIPGSQIRPVPSLEIAYPEVRLLPEGDRMRAAGFTADDLGVAVDVLLDGRKISDFKREGEKKIDLTMMASREEIHNPEELYNAPLTVKDGTSVPLSSLMKMERTYGIPQIRHLERQRTITLQITPPTNVPIEQAMDLIQTDVVPAVRAQGLLEGKTVSLSGSADKLTQTRRALQWDLVLAAIITYLLMSALFGNFLYPFIIMFTVPLAGAGGFLGLFLVSRFIAPQPLDILTMLGFVILIGVVVNNAILIVHQSLNNVRHQGLVGKAAVEESVRSRIRPIYMSTLTSLFGMLPLVVAPGPGSELYRGLGAVLLGGLAFSSVFTVFMIPAILTFFIGMEKPGLAGATEGATA
ncbi:MAG: efflux RND transporter permease subunit [Thermodesulfobacteriota bacterium]